MDQRLTLQRCREQHTAIRRLLDRVPLAEPLNEDDIVALLRRLERMLRTHLQLEEGVLYPLLENSALPLLQRKAARYQTHMRPVGAMFTEMCHRWQSAGSISKEPARFLSEWTAASHALQMRIESEDEDLYALTEAFIKAGEGQP